MMGNLFDFDTPRYPEAPGHRGVETSIAAASAMQPKLGRLQGMVLSAIKGAASYGLTTDECCDTLGLDRWTVQPRTSELRAKRLIGDSGRRRKNSSGKQAIVWVMSEYLADTARAEAA